MTCKICGAKLKKLGKTATDGLLSVCPECKRYAVTRLDLYIEDMQNVVDNSSRDSNDLLIKIYKERIEYLSTCKELTEAAIKTEKAEKALELACDFIADTNNSCPFDNGSRCSKPGEWCDDNAGECFKKYFLEKALEEK